MEQQFTVTLDSDLIRDIPLRSNDERSTPSDLVARALGDHLRFGAHTAGAEPIVLQPMVHVKDVGTMVALLEALGGRVVLGSRDGDWVQVAVGGAEVGLLAHPANPEQGEGDVELTFRSREALESVAARAEAAGVSIAAPVTDQGLGRQLQLRSGDGLLVKVNEIKDELVR